MYNGIILIVRDKYKCYCYEPISKQYLLISTYNDISTLVHNLGAETLHSLILGEYVGTEHIYIQNILKSKTPLIKSSEFYGYSDITTFLQNIIDKEIFDKI